MNKSKSKVCTKCGQLKSIRDFYKHPETKDGLDPRCKNCHRKECAESRRVYDKTKKGKRSKFKAHLKYKYNITVDEYDSMFEEQNGVCKVCGLPEINRRLAVDHDHKTNKVRGLLCSSCNVQLGWFERNIINVLDYLK